MKPVIQTYSGGTINFADPDESVFTVEDIAHGLSNTSRYSGQCKHHYSVSNAIYNPITITLSYPTGKFSNLF